MGFESSFSTKLVYQIGERTRELTGVQAAQRARDSTEARLEGAQ
jgi:hypothetical protein